MIKKFEVPQIFYRIVTLRLVTIQCKEVFLRSGGHEKKNHNYIFSYMQISDHETLQPPALWIYNLTHKPDIAWRCPQLIHFNYKRFWSSSSQICKFWSVFNAIHYWWSWWGYTFIILSCMGNILCVISFSSPRWNTEKHCDFIWNYSLRIVKPDWLHYKKR